MSVTIVDVIENFFGRPSFNELMKIPSRKLLEFGEEVRRFSKSQVEFSSGKTYFPLYMGGWPSANFWYAQESNFILTSLLFSGQVLVKDQLSNWFSLEQYKVPHKLTARQGFLNIETGEFNALRTRHFLATVIPKILALKPLIQNSVIKMMPSSEFVFENEQVISQISDDVFRKLEFNAQEFTQKFTPVDLAVEDNVRGFFVFAGGDQEQQIAQTLNDAIRYFVGEYLFASKFGYTYCAPFPFEGYLCQKGLDGVINEAPRVKVLKSLFNTDLPIFKGLSPKLVAEIKDDDSYCDFRSTLSKIYGGIPSGISEAEFQAYISDQEEAYLKPIISKIKKDASHGVFSKLGMRIVELALKVSGSVVSGKLLDPEVNPQTLALAAGSSELISMIASKLGSSSKKSINIWTRLYREHLSVNEEMSSVKQSTGTNVVPSKKLWGIPLKPSMNVTVSEGSMFQEIITSPKSTPTALKEPNGSVYGPCKCGSGLKYKFCCRSLDQVNMKKVLWRWQ